MAVTFGANCAMAARGEDKTRTNRIHALLFKTVDLRAEGGLISNIVNFLMFGTMGGAMNQSIVTLPAPPSGAPFLTTSLGKSPIH